MAPQLPHWLPMSCGFSSGQVEISGASAFCIEGSSVIANEDNALIERYKQAFANLETAFSQLIVARVETNRRLATADITRDIAFRDRAVA